MIIDITGVELIPGNAGKDCPGNGMHPDVECCCDACDYLLCCMESYSETECLTCSDTKCPRSVTI